MEILVNASATCYCPHYSFQANPRNKHVKARTFIVHCSRQNEKVNGMYSGSPQVELEDQSNMEIRQFSDVPPEDNNNNVWKLFRETQQNILYLNKQRLMAVEEMKKAKDENQLLLDRVKELELQLDNVGKSPLNISEKSSICSMLLLRIDAMVLTGMIATKEASELRRLVIHHKVGIANVFADIKHTRDAELLVELRNFSNNVTQIGFHIVHICTEMAPVASVGSLALYVTGLSCALQEKGNLVEVILPKYASLDLDGIQGLQDIEAEFYSYFNGNWHGNRIWTGVVQGIGVTFIEPMNNSSFFNRDMIYGYSDDFERFSYFSRASLDYILKSGKHPDVLHIHNSETAVVGPLFWDVFVNQLEPLIILAYENEADNAFGRLPRNPKMHSFYIGLGSTRILFTCHDFKTQYLEQPEKLALCGLDPSRLHQHDRLQDSNKQHLINILKGGIVYSNKVLIMSSIHSKSRIMSSMSHGLESTLAIHKEKLLVAPYGYDGIVWDPSKDKFLPAKYSANDIKGKAICKVALRQRIALSGDISTVTVGCICPEVSDTDLENLTVAIQLTSQKKAQFIFMGVSSILSVNTALQLLQKKLEDEDVKIINKYDEALSHLLLAGADIILCPSFHDPVHQMPLKALKYGAAPVAMNSNHGMFRQAVVHDFERTQSSEYIISFYGNMSLGEALDQIRRNPSQWNQKIKDGMEKDFSWAAECYDVHLAAYTSITNL